MAAQGLARAGETMKALDQLRSVMRRDQVFDIVRDRESLFSGGRHVADFSAVDVSHEMILYVENINVSFDGFKALNDLTLYIKDRELRCVIGPNGAGKTTMMDVITGRTRPDSGLAYFGQTMDLTRMSEYEIASAGIGRKFQKPTIFPEHSAFENLELAMKMDKRVWPTLFATLNGEQNDRIEEVLMLIGLTDQRRLKAASLSHGQKQWLEIGMLLIQSPRLLLVDEPIAGMTQQEAERTAELLVALTDEHGHSVVVVEHDMEFVRSIARQVTVLHEGHVIAEGTMDQVQNNSQVIEIYLGE